MHSMITRMDACVPRTNAVRSSFTRYGVITTASMRFTHDEERRAVMDQARVIPVRINITRMSRSQITGGESHVMRRDWRARRICAPHHHYRRMRHIAVSNIRWLHSESFSIEGWGAAH